MATLVSSAPDPRPPARLRVGLLLAVGLVASSAPAAGQSCAELTPADFGDIPWKSAAAAAVQATVHTAYRADGSEALLTDSILGTATVGLMRRFCEEAGLGPAADLQSLVVGALSAFARATAQYPTWREIVGSADFERWARGLPEAPVGRFYVVRHDAPLVPAGALLLDAYTAAAAEPEPAAPVGDGMTGLFVLTADDLDALAESVAYGLDTEAAARLTVADAPAGLVQRIGALQQITFPSPDSLREAVDAILAEEVGDSTPPPPPTAAETGLLTAAQYLGLVVADIDSLPRLGDTLAYIADRMARFRLNRNAAPRLTAAGAPAALVARVEALEELPFATRTSLVEALDTIFTEEVDRAEPEPRPPPPDPDSVAARFRDLLALPPVATEPAGEPGPAPSPQLVPTAEQLAALGGLVGVRFPDGHLFRTAVRLTTGIGRSSPALLGRILARARKTRVPPPADSLGLLPIAWRGGPCGCGTFVRSSDADPDFLYGVYPFWAVTQETDPSQPAEVTPQVIDFSTLTRIGYYGLRFDRGGRVVDALHWRRGEHPEDAWFWKRRGFADFVELAHEYKTKVDVVLYNGDWAEWLPRSGAATDSAEAGRSAGAALARLTTEAVGLISPELDNVIDRLKPIVSLGQSPRRTLGDGLTLELDVAGLAGADQQWLFDRMVEHRFFETLDAALDSVDGSDGGLLLNLDLDYALNLLVPGYCLAGGADGGAASTCAFFALDNLVRIEPYVDLFIVDMSAQTPRAPAASAGVDGLEELTAGLGRLTPAEEIALLRKVVPLVPTSPTADATETADPEALFGYAEWHFTGVGTWPMPADTAVTGALARVFFPEPEPRTSPRIAAELDRRVWAPVGALATEACRLTCPNRWPVRVLVFFVLAVGSVYGLASVWLFELRRLYEYRTFQIGTAATAVVLIVTLLCDPYWKEQQSVILFVSLGIFLGLWTVSRSRKQRERNYP